MKEKLKKIASLPAALALKIRDAFSWKPGKTILKMGNNTQTAKDGAVVLSVRSNRWTRLWRVVAFPFIYVWKGSAKL